MSKDRMVKDYCDSCGKPTNKDTGMWYYDEASWYCYPCTNKIFAADRKEQEELKPLATGGIIKGPLPDLLWMNNSLLPINKK